MNTLDCLKTSEGQYLTHIEQLSQICLDKIQDTLVFNFFRKFESRCAKTPKKPSCENNTFL